MVGWILGKLKWLTILCAVGGPVVALACWQDGNRRRDVMAMGIQTEATIESATRVKRRRGGTNYKLDLSWTDASGLKRTVEEVSISHALADKLAAEPLMPGWALSLYSAALGPVLILTGLTKKIVLADYISVNLVDRVFDNPDAFTAAEVVVGLYGFTLQIYADFSGYTDVARGSAKLFGIELPENFDRPYQAKSPAEFWRRWHMTLSTWLRDYLYFPLGGSKLGEARTYFNLWLTIFLIGLWHGAAWTFVIYGAMQATAVVLHRLTTRITGKRSGEPDPLWLTILKIVGTMQFVVFSRILFRAESLENAGDKAALLREIAAALEFPGGFGANWDALADSLGDLSWLSAPGYLLLLDHCADAGGHRHLRNSDCEAAIREVVGRRGDTFGNQAANSITGAALMVEIDRRRRAVLAAKQVPHVGGLTKMRAEGIRSADQNDHLAFGRETDLRHPGPVHDQADTADGRCWQNALSIRLVVKRDVAGHDREVERAAGFADTFYRVDELAHDLGPFGVAEVEIVGRGKRERPGSRQVAPAFCDGLLAAFVRIGLAIARIDVGREGEGLGGMPLDARDACVSAGNLKRVALDQRVVLFPDPATR